MMMRSERGRLEMGVLIVTVVMAACSTELPAARADGGDGAVKASAASMTRRAPASVPREDTLGFPAPVRPTSAIVAPRWSGEDERDRLNEAAEVIALAKVRAGMTVADIGAGDGYYVARLSPIVGESGQVIGEDITPEYLELLHQRVKREGWRNVSVVQGTPSDPRLPLRAVDVALLIHMYHEITRPFELLWHLSASMKQGGTVAVLDQDTPTDRHGTPPTLLGCELGVMGFVPVSRMTLQDGAYVALFTAPDAPVAPAIVRERLAKAPCTVAR